MTRQTGWHRTALRFAVLALCTVSAGAALAQERRLSPPLLQYPEERIPSYNLYGLPGLIEMPTAEMAPDATLSTTIGYAGNATRGTLSFQVLPRVIGSFRYSLLTDADIAGARDGDYYDRSFDLRFQLLKEGTYLPAFSVGLQDFIGTGLYGGEYVVATKEVLPGVRLTGGLGWGRFGSYQSFGNTGDRPGTVNGRLDPEAIGRGGTANFDRFFRGDVSAFGGLSWDVTDRFRAKLEYSSDDYEVERTTSAGFEKTSPWNFGVDYRFENGNQLSLYHVYGTEVGAQLTILTNPRTAPVPGGNESYPYPVKRRDPARVADLGWTTDQRRQARIRSGLGEALDGIGITLQGMTLEGNRATVRIQNRRYQAVPQAVGRTARTMSRALPDSISEFVIVITEGGLPASAVTLRRGDLEQLEFDSAEAIYARADIVDSVGLTPRPFPDTYPKIDWSFGPYLAYSSFDPDNPLRIDYGVRAKASVMLTAGLELAGSVSHRLGGNIADGSDEVNTELPSVRTSAPLYADGSDTRLDRLTLAHFGRPAEDFYSRVTVGYLESMYAGASAEVLWKPVDSRLGLGAEINYVRRREFDQGFGLQSNTTPTGEIPEVNGHISAYYDLGYGFHTQIDVGRYLAGDEGATLSVHREFDNGWRVGAFATKTNVSAEEFGEGSFDKGITVTIPLNWALGSQTRQTSTTTIRPVTRDGGARLSVSDRLYGRVRDNHEPELAKTWGRFWR